MSWEFKHKKASESTTAAIGRLGIFLHILTQSRESPGLLQRAEIARPNISRKMPPSQNSGAPRKHCQNTKKYPKRAFLVSQGYFRGICWGMGREFRAGGHFLGIFFAGLAFSDFCSRLGRSRSHKIFREALVRFGSVAVCARNGSSCSGLQFRQEQVSSHILCVKSRRARCSKFGQLRSGQSTVGGPKWTSLGQNPVRNKVILTKTVFWTILVQHIFRQYRGDSLPTLLCNNVLRIAKTCRNNAL